MNAAPKARDPYAIAFSWAKARGIEREEVYQSNAPAHWPRDRCMMLESDAQFLDRIQGLMRRRLK